MKEVICCPEFHPELWDEKVFEWFEKPFVKAKVLTLLYMPLNFGQVIKKLDSKLHNSGVEITDSMGLSDHTSTWNMDLYLAVDKDVEGLDNVKFTGTFLSKVYEGKFNKTGEWCKDFEEFAKKRYARIEKMYMWYTTCPKCAKKYGKNYVVILAKVVL